MLLEEDRVVDGRVLHVRLEDLGDDRIRATVAVRHLWRKKDFEQLGFAPLPLRGATERLVREILGQHADLERAWVCGAALSAEGKRRQLEFVR